MDKENAIIIDGVKHTLKQGSHLNCSLSSLCHWVGSPMCEKLFGKEGCHFEILKQEPERKEECLHTP